MNAKVLMLETDVHNSFEVQMCESLLCVFNVFRRIRKLYFLHYLQDN
jgi:hypothetical protein